MFHMILWQINIFSKGLCNVFFQTFSMSLTCIPVQLTEGIVGNSWYFDMGPRAPLRDVLTAPSRGVLGVNLLVFDRPA